MIVISAGVKRETLKNLRMKEGVLRQRRVNGHLEDLRWIKHIVRSWQVRGMTSHAQASRTVAQSERDLMMTEHHAGEQQATARKETKVTPSSVFPNMRMACSRNEDMMNSTEEQKHQNMWNTKHGVQCRECDSECGAQERQRSCSHARPKITIKHKEGILGVPPRKHQEEGK